MRQGGDPRLPLELALVKVTRPQADLSRESLAHRVELLENRAPALGHPAPALAAPAEPSAPPPHRPPGPPAEVPEASAPTIDLDQVTDAWQRSIVEAVRERSIPVASLLEEARPTELAGDTLTLEFPAGADFHRRQVAEPNNIGVLREALYEVTGRRLARRARDGRGRGAGPAADPPLSEEDVISLLKETLDAEEVKETDE